MIPVYFKKLFEDATIPTFGHGDITNSAVDLYAYIPKEYVDTDTISERFIILEAKESVVISAGVAWYIDTEYLDTFLRVGESFGSSERLFKLGMTINSRSGLAMKQGIETSNAGIIDEGYSGCIHIKLYNNSDTSFVLRHGDRIAQGKIELLPMVEIKEWEFNKDFPETERGKKGFGSSGK